MFNSQIREEFKAIKKVYVGTNKDPGFLDPDISLAELATPFKWSSSVQPACLPKSDFVPKYEGILMVSARACSPCRSSLNQPAIGRCIKANSKLNHNL